MELIGGLAGVALLPRLPILRLILALLNLILPNHGS